MKENPGTRSTGEPSREHMPKLMDDHEAEPRESDKREDKQDLVVTPWRLAHFWTLFLMLNRRSSIRVARSCFHDSGFGFLPDSVSPVLQALAKCQCFLPSLSRNDAVRNHE